jgi:hypothetical protein
MEPSLKVISGELKSAAADSELAQVSYATELEALSAGATRSRLEHTGAAIGLSAPTVRKILDDWVRRASLMRAGHLIIERLRRRPERMHWWQFWLAVP